ncbi:MAG TPA: hypothetical protein VIQ74_05005 [Gemmatimonadaceae bacterium]|jgi:hypothetical protein
MDSLFILCTVLGGGVLVLQLVLGIFGIDSDHDVGHLDIDHEITHGSGPADASHGHVGDGLHLFSVRAIAAGIAFFGLAGLAATHAGWPVLLALVAAVVPGFLAMLLVAYIMRWMLRLDSDQSIHADNAIGQGGTVYIPIPGAGAGLGKVTLALHGRTVEYEAITRGAALSTGTQVTIIDVREPDILEVVPTPTLDEVL